MVDITLYNEKMHVPEGTRIIDLLKEEDKKNYIVCHVGAQIKELFGKRIAKGIAVRTTFIVGFPGETEKDFADAGAFHTSLFFFGCVPSRKTSFRR